MGNDSSSLKRFSIKGSAHGTSSKQGSSTQSQTMPVVSPNQGQAQASASGSAPAQTSAPAAAPAPASAAPPAQKSPTSAAAAAANANGNGAAAAAPSADDIANAPTVEETATAAFGSQIEANEKKNKVGLEDFALLKTVGKGSFGKVIQVRKKDTGKIYAMKVLKKDQVIRRKQYEHTMAERRILEAIDHPFIVSLRFAFQTNSKLYMIFDYFAGGELFHYLSQGGRFSEDRARLYAAEIALALEHVHALNIIYRDLKPENLLLDSDGHIRVTDFGLSKENVTDDSVKSFCGTPEYLAPEVLKRQKYGKAVDWWSLGTLLYEMIAGLPPYYDRNRERMYKKILGAELRFPSHMSPEAKSICRGMLMREPEERLGYRGAQEVKAHPFFAFLNFDDVLAKRVEPPFKPSVADDEDTRNVDKSFINMPAEISPTLAEESGIAAAAGAKFDGFTFVAKSVLEGARGGDFAAKNNTEEEAELSEYQRRLAAGNGTIPE